jgi:cytosine/adenosine deaminase-related metal-dependent hydrolase
MSLLPATIAVPSGSDATTVCNAVKAGDTFVVHVAEGTDGPALNEFTSLSNAASGCLISSHVTIVHGTALQTTHFQTMATADMGLVWSPKSNVFLYGSTTDIPAAMAAGVKKIALGPDWALGGSVNMLADGHSYPRWNGHELGRVKAVEAVGAARA